MTKIVLENSTGMAVSGKADIGRWDYEWRNGRSMFRGKLLGDKEWSPWMLKRELREWFAQKVDQPN